MPFVWRLSLVSVTLFDFLFQLVGEAGAWVSCSSVLLKTLWPWFSQAGGSPGKKRQGGFVYLPKLEGSTPLQDVPESTSTATWGQVSTFHHADGAHGPPHSQTFLLECEGFPARNAHGLF